MRWTVIKSTPRNLPNWPAAGNKLAENVKIG